MARMIPPVPYADTESDGELAVFQRLRDEPGSDDWIVLHSVNLAEHRKSVAGEADFVVIVPGHGVLVIEVKGWRSLRLVDGGWYHGKEQKADNRGPFRQASQAMWSLRDFLLKSRPDLAASLFWSACVFPFCELSVPSPEWHPWQVIDRRTFTTKTMAQHVLEVLKRAREQAASKGMNWAQGGAGQPTVAQASVIATLLRPRYEVFEARGAEDRRTEAELKAFTKQQYRILDALQANQRVLAEGPAGSGKTVLALESARRFLSSAVASGGRRLLFTCFNAPLAAWAKRQLEPLGPNVTVDSLHRHMLRAAGISAAPTGADRRYWNTDLPALALQALRKRGSEAELFDYLVLDEAQDCLEPAYLDVLDGSIKGGLESGRWHAFGDFEKQAIYEQTPGTVELGLAHLRDLGVSVRLRSNCRNTPRIAALVPLLAGLDPDYDEVLRPDDGRDATWVFHTDIQDGQRKLIEQVQALLDDGVAERDIIVLSSKRDEECLAASTRLPGHRLVPLRGGDGKGVRYGTIHAFKGLEARAVILTDLDALTGPRSQDLLYVGITRAQSRLTILAESSLQAQLASLISNSASRSRPR